MLVARNLKHVDSSKRQARLKVIAGLALFIAGAPLSFLSIRFLVAAYTLVIIGFVLFNTGLQGIAKWGRKVRNDQMVDNELRRLSDRYTVIHYAALGRRVPEHILIHETGIVVMTTKEVVGRVEVRGKTFRKLGQGMFGRFLGFSGPQLGQPGVENGLDRKAVLEALAAEAAARDWPTDVPVDGLVIFTAPRAVLRVAEDADPSAVKIGDLLGWVQNHTRGMPIVLPSDARQEIAEFLIARGGALMEGHLDPRGAVAEDAPASRRPARTRPNTPEQVIKTRSERERQARARTATPAEAASPATTTGRGRRRTAEPVEATPVREASPLVPTSGMAKVKRRERTR